MILFMEFSYEITKRKKTAADRGLISLVEIIFWLQLLVQLELQEHLS